MSGAREPAPPATPSGFACPQRRREGGAGRAVSPRRRFSPPPPPSGLRLAGEVIHPPRRCHLRFPGAAGAGEAGDRAGERSPAQIKWRSPSLGAFRNATPIPGGG